MIGIDSSAIIDFLKGNQKLGRYMQEASLAEITYIEIIRGTQNEAIVEQLFSSLPNYAMTKLVMKRANSILLDCQNKGKPIPIFDALIAATFLQNGITTIVTNDKHFKEIKGIKVITY
jgi:predicted nucleic acid-binding protein